MVEAVKEIPFSEEAYDDAIASLRLCLKDLNPEDLDDLKRLAYLTYLKDLFSAMQDEEPRIDLEPVVGSLAALCKSMGKVLHHGATYEDDRRNCKRICLKAFPNYKELVAQCEGESRRRFAADKIHGSSAKMPKRDRPLPRRSSRLSYITGQYMLRAQNGGTGSGNTGEPKKKRQKR